ncbi:heavy metal-associated isoprenylated plant protein 43-like [Cucurbita moschata]|uniref:Heavy metal-associated isoprenylated plant protein 43-like n=2 Tax=Cucurbita TaxID=3660 RepID=A0A6J1GFG8_CUCMO
MAMTKTILKLDITCHKCKTKVLKAVTALEGVDKIEMDEAKGTLAVTGTADPYDIVTRTRKAISCAGKIADIDTIGPPPKPNPPPKPTPQPSCSCPPFPPPYCPCPSYPPYYGSSYVVVPHETYPSCSIL